MYKYETHLHTAPVSRCAKATVRESLEFYKRIGYDGVFITNHFIDGNINIDKSLPYRERVEFYFSDYENGVQLSKEIGISVFCGVEMSYGGTDFLVYGLFKEWYLSHPEIEVMKRSELLKILMSEGALVIQAHPFREASYIDTIRIMPYNIDGMEVLNVKNSKRANDVALLYADLNEIPKTCGSDCHHNMDNNLCAMGSEVKINNVSEFFEKLKNGELKMFKKDEGKDFYEV